MKITYPPGVLTIDVSKWDDHLNISELVAGGVKAIILGFYKKWSWGKYVLNDNCKRLADQIATSGVLMMAYKYYYVAEDPVKDADWFVDMLAPYPVKYAWADCEDTTVAPRQLTRSEQNRRFMLELHTRFSQSGLYTAKWYVNGYAPAMDVWMAHYQTWIAHYKYQPTLKTSMSWEELKANWMPNYDVLATLGMLTEKFVGHQFTGNRVMLPGVYDYYNRRLVLDVNVFKPEFIASLGSAVIPAPPITPPATTYTEYVVLSWQLSVRFGPGTGYGKAYSAVQGQVLRVASTTVVNGYVKLTDGNWAYFSYLVKKA